LQESSTEVDGHEDFKLSTFYNHKQHKEQKG